MRHDASNSREIPRRQFIRTMGYAAAAGSVLAESFAAEPAVEPKTITLALVGCAHIHTPNYIRILKSRPGARVKWVWDHDRNRAEKAARVLGCEVAENPEVIWSDRDIAAVVICSETNRHHDLVLSAVAAGKHLFVEKPLGITAAESDAMAAAIEKQRLIFTTGYFMRTEPAHLFLKDHVMRGSFGTITRVRGSNCHNGSLGHWFDTDWRWMADPKIAGVGAFGDLGTHSLDILMWLLGGVDSITADIKAVTGNYEGCDESGEALMRFKSGITGTLAAGWVDVENPVPLLISGTEGHAVIFQNDLYFKSSHVAGADGKQPWRELPAALPEPMDQFLNALAGGSSATLVTPREAAARVSVMEAAYKSSQARTWIKPA